MNRWETLGFNALGAIVTASGLAYLVMKYVLGSDDPFAVVNHPWQPAMLAVHVIAAPLVILVFGMLFRSHVLDKLLSRRRPARRSGWTSLVSFLVMAASGYLLQVTIDPAWLRALVWVHVGASALFVAGYATHLLVGWGTPPALRIAACLGVLLAAGAAPQGAVQPVKRQAYLMGTRASLTILAVDRRQGLDSLERMLRVLEAAEAELSTWRPDTLLSAINRQPVGMPWSGPASLCSLLGELALWHRETAGAFDPAVGSLIRAWGLREAGRWPEPAELGRARAASGLGHLAIERAPCRITRLRELLIDAGAFGKGEALDRVAAEARAAGARPWIVDLGGQVAVGASDGEGWPVALAHPRRRGEAALELRLDSGSLATSGGAERDLEVDGRAIGHILDPRSGRPLSRALSVTVWHRRALIADVLSTALYVMGPERGLAWAEQRAIAACFLIPEERGAAFTVRASRAFTERFLTGNAPGPGAR